MSEHDANTSSREIVIIGAGPAGYEAALVARSYHYPVTLIDGGGIGGAAVLTDCVPSKTVIASARSANLASDAGRLGVYFNADSPSTSGGERAQVDLARVNARTRSLAESQSADIEARLRREGVHIIRGIGRLTADRQVEVRGGDGTSSVLPFEYCLIATGARPAHLADTAVDGERILTWQQLWDLDEVPPELVVVGSGVTGAELAGAYAALGSRVTLVSSRDRVLPGEDADAAELVASEFTRRGLQIVSRSRASHVRREDDRVVVELTDGRELQGSHCLLAVGSHPNTADVGLEAAGVRTTSRGHIDVDGASRTNVLGIYAAGDVTGRLPLASVAAMQGRIAMWHALGQELVPLSLVGVPSTVFTDPEIAQVGIPPDSLAAEPGTGHVVFQPLATNPRAKMQDLREGFIKLAVRTDGTIVGGVIVAPRASDLIHALAIAVERHLTAKEFARVMTVYPSLSGSLAEAARRAADYSP